MWQGLEPWNPFSLLTVNYGAGILVGEDADCIFQGSSAEFSCHSAVSEQASDV